MADRSAERSVVPYLFGFVFVGLVLSIGGPSLSHLKGQVGTGDGGIGLVFVGQSAGYIVGSIAGGRLLDRGYGHKMWSAAIALTLVALLGASVADNLAALVAAFLVVGVASGSCDVAGNTLVMWSRPNGATASLNALHLAFAVGALTSPIVVNRALFWSDSLWPMLIPIGVLGAVCVVRFSGMSAPSARHSAVLRSGTDRVINLPLTEKPKQAANGRSLVVVALFYLAYVAMETGFASWLHEYTLQIGYGTEDTATALMLTFWSGFVAGRVAAIAVARRLSAGWIVAISMAMCLVASLLFFVFPNGGPTLWPVTFLFAFSVAPQYASMLSYFQQHRSLSGAATSSFVAASGLGGLVMPWTVGQLFDWRGPTVFPPTMLVLAIASVIAAVAVRAVVGASATASDVQERPGQIVGGVGS